MPVSFEEHRTRLIQALDEAGWPIAVINITRLEKEIERGLQFLRQSQDLRQIAANNTSADQVSLV